MNLLKTMNETPLEKRILLTCFSAGITAGISSQMLTEEIPYVRVLAFNDRGRQLLASHKKTGFFRNAGEAVDHPLWVLERRWEDLYGLFRLNAPDAPGREEQRRVRYVR